MFLFSDNLLKQDFYEIKNYVLILSNTLKSLYLVVANCKRYILPNHIIVYLFTINIKHRYNCSASIIEFPWLPLKRKMPKTWEFLTTDVFLKQMIWMERSFSKHHKYLFVDFMNIIIINRRGKELLIRVKRSILHLIYDWSI